MNQLRGLASFLTTVIVVFGVLRLAHLLLPLAYPPALGGPFSLDQPSEIERYAGFEPLMPFYRPEVLGPRAVTITAWRRPLPRAKVFWQGTRFLVLDQRQGGARPELDGTARPLPAWGEGWWWRQGRTLHAVMQRDGIWLVLRTDLDAEELERILRTLRPYGELL